MPFVRDHSELSPRSPPGVTFVDFGDIRSKSNNNKYSSQCSSSLYTPKPESLSPLLSASSAYTSFSSAASTSSASSSASASTSTFPSPPRTPCRQSSTDNVSTPIKRPLWMPATVRPSSHRRVSSFHKRMAAESDNNCEDGYDSEFEDRKPRERNIQPLLLRERLEEVRARSTSRPRSSSRVSAQTNLQTIVASPHRPPTDTYNNSPQINIEVQPMAVNASPAPRDSPRSSLDTPPPKPYETFRNPESFSDYRRASLIRSRKPPPLNLGNATDCGPHVAKSGGIPHAFRGVEKKTMIGLGLGLGLPSGMTKEPTVTLSMAAVRESRLVLEARRPATAPYWRSATCPVKPELSPPPLSAPPRLACPPKPRLLPTRSSPRSPSPLLLGSPRFDALVREKKQSSSTRVEGVVGVRERRRTSMKIMIEELANNGRESPVPPGLVGSPHLKRFGVGVNKVGIVRRSSGLARVGDEGSGEGEGRRADSPWAEAIDGKIALREEGEVGSFNPYFAEAHLSAHKVVTDDVYLL